MIQFYYNMINFLNTYVHMHVYKYRYNFETNKIRKLVRIFTFYLLSKINRRTYLHVYKMVSSIKYKFRQLTLIIYIYFHAYILMSL